jgi:predicted ATPase
VEAFELAGATATRTRLQVAAVRGLTPFIGRDGELDQLGHASESASAGRGQVVAVVGDPGVGKSRLFREFVGSRHTKGWLVLESRSASYGRDTAYLPVVDLLEGYFQIQPGDDQRRVREKVTGKMLALDEGLRAMLSAILALLEVPVEDEGWRALGSSQQRRRTTEAVTQLLLAESRARPLCVVFEDLHWIDP